MTLCTISPISWRSPSVRMIGSREVLEAFDFFHGPTYSLWCWHFNCVDATSRSTPPSSVSSSSSGEGDLWPSHSFSASYCCSATATSFLLFSANYTICSFTSSSFFCAADFFVLVMVMAGVRHSSGHDSSTMNMTSYVAKYESWFHFFVGFLCTMTYTC